MKNTKRALRRYQKGIKHKARLVEWAMWLDVIHYWDDDGVRHEIYNPTWTDVKKHWEKMSNRLKTMSTVCSCSMCAYEKYDRRKQKRLDRMFLKLGMEE